MIHAPRLPLVALTLAGAVMLAPVPASAQPAAPADSGPAPTESPPPDHRSSITRLQDGREASATLLAGINKLFAFATADEVPNKLQTAAFLDREIAPYFDFEYIARYVTGARWQGLNPQQRKALMAQLEASILSGVAERLLMPPGQRVRYLRPRPGKQESVDVRVGMSPPPGWRGGPTPASRQPLVFRMYRTDDGWKTFDLLVDGRSLIGAYQDRFDGSGRTPKDR